MNYEQIFTNIMKDIKNNYSYLCFKKTNIERLLEKSIEFKEIKTEKEFILKLTKALSVFRDPHLSVIDSNGRKFKTFRREYEKNYNREITKKYFTKELFKTSISKVCLIKDILYIEIITWSKHKKEEIIKTLEFIKKIIDKHEKLIIDVRPNQGGADSFAMRLVSYFIPKGKESPVAVYKYRTDKNEPCKLGKEHTRTVRGSLENHFKGKVCVLIGKACLSSNEAFIMAMKNLKNSILIGDCTFGSSGNPKEFKYNNIIVRIPSWVVYKMNGELLEGNGIKPDVLIKTEESFVNNKDLVLEKAIEILRKGE